MAHKAINEAAEERDQVLNEMNNHRNLSYTIEASKDEV